MAKGECRLVLDTEGNVTLKKCPCFPLLICAMHWGSECMAETPWLWPSWNTWWWDLNKCLSSWSCTDLMVTWAFARKEASCLIWDEIFPCDHKACSVEQRPSTCQSAVLSGGGAEAEARGSLCLSGWDGLRVYQCEQSSIKVFCLFFIIIIYVSSGWQGSRQEEEGA